MAKGIDLVILGTNQNTQPPGICSHLLSEFSALKILPKGPKAKCGSPKPGLADIYRAAKLPRVRIPDQLPKGEQDMLDDRNLRKFVQELYLPPSAPPTNKSPTKKSGRPQGRPT